MPQPAGHQVDLAGADHGVRAEAVAVLDLAGEQPADGLQPGVRVRRHVHAAGAGDVVRAVVVGEAPGADQRALPLRAGCAARSSRAGRRGGRRGLRGPPRRRRGASWDRRSPAALSRRCSRAQSARPGAGPGRSPSTVWLSGPIAAPAEHGTWRELTCGVRRPAGPTKATGTHTMTSQGLSSSRRRGGDWTPGWSGSCGSGLPRTDSRGTGRRAGRPPPSSSSPASDCPGTCFRSPPPSLQAAHRASWSTPWPFAVMAVECRLPSTGSRQPGRSVCVG